MKRKTTWILLAAATIAGLGLLSMRGLTAIITRDVDGGMDGARQPIAAYEAMSAGGSATLTTTCALTNQVPTVRGTLPYVLTAAEPFEKPLRLAVEAMGAKTVAFLSANQLLVEADAAVLARLKADARLASVVERLPAVKIEATLAERLAAGAKSVEATVVTLAAADRATVIAKVTGAGGEILSGCLNGADSFTARLSSALVADLAARGDVQWLEAFERPKFNNDIAVDPVGMNIRPFWLSGENPGGLSGAGQVVTTSDTGIDTGDVSTMHADLANQVVGMRVYNGCFNRDENGHGTHTAGSIVGDGTMSDGAIRGSAWGAKLFAWFCQGQDGYVYTPAPADLFRPVQSEYPAYIHSASWGAAIGGRYNDECSKVDKDIWEHPDFLPVFSAGNEGDDGRQTIGAPGSAKNVLTVGATQNSRFGHDGGWGNGDTKTVARFSSRGPCADGRIKPDVASPGVGVLSTRAAGKSYSYGIYDDYYAYDSGTSMATPLTAGAVALIREWLLKRDEFAEEETETAKHPTAALMKAVITGGAADVLTPDYSKGWGRVDIGETLYPTDRAVKLVDRIPFAATSNFIYVVETTNAAPLEVQLAWIDYPAASSARTTLVNDLDLTVEAEFDGKEYIWYGNGGDEPDRVNNVESVRLASARPTKYLITVDCARILHDFTEGGAAALYIRGAFDPEATPTMPARVRIPERDLGFRSLSRALVEVRSGETVEVLKPTPLGSSIVVKADCTIVATNDNPSASAVVVPDGASFVVAPGVKLSLTNVCFTSKTQPVITVETNAVLSISGTVDLGTIETKDATGLDLAGAVSKALTVVTPERTTGAAFATYSCSRETAEGCANYLLNAADDELGGKVEDAAIVWGVVPVPDDAAVLRLGTAEETTNYRAFAVLAKHLPTSGDLTVGVLKDCPMANRLSVKGRTLRLYGDSPSDLPVSVSADTTSGFVVSDGGALVMTNLTFSGYRNPKDSFVTVESGDVTLECGAALVDMAVTKDIYLENREVRTTLGVVALYEGSFTLLSGARLERLSGAANGGAITSYAGIVNLLGGTITGCSAAQFGGAVYAYGDYGARVRVAGDVKVAGNHSGNGPNGDDIYLATAEWPLEIVTDLLSGAKVGVWYPNVGEDNVNVEGGLAARLGAEVSDKTGSAAAIFSNVEPNLVAEVMAGDETKLVWKYVEPAETSEDPSQADVRVISADGTTNYYDTISLAFRHATEGCAVEVLRAWVQMAEDVIVDCSDVTLRPRAGLDEAVLGRFVGSILVRPGASLTVEDLLVVDEGSFLLLLEPDPNPLFIVNGGALTLCGETGVSYQTGEASRAASAIVVYDGGVFTMEDEVELTDNWNVFTDENPANTGVGGAVLIDNATAYFRGGLVYDNKASAGGGIELENKSIAYVSGNFSVFDNTTLEGVANNLVASDNSKICIEAPLADAAVIGITPGFRADTNLVGYVANWTDESVWSLTSLTNSAARFFADADPMVCGVVVTNASDTARIVWSTALAADGSYKRETVDGLTEVFYLMGERADPGPGPEPEFAQPASIAFSKIEMSADRVEVTLAFTNAVQWCNYAIFGTNSLTGGFVTDGVTPVTNFQWTVEEPKIELKLPTNGNLFWKATASEGLVQ